MNKTLKIVSSILLAISTVMLSFQLIIGEYTWISIEVTTIVTFGCAIYFYMRTIENVWRNIKKNKFFCAFCAILAGMVFIELYLTKAAPYKNSWTLTSINPFRFRYYSIAIFSMVYLGIFLGTQIKHWIFNLYQSMDTWDKKAYLICSLIGLGVILIAYNFNANWHLQYKNDQVYGMDTGKCLKYIMPNANYYVVRHPIISIFTFPVFAVVHFTLKILFDGAILSTVEVIIFQYINIQMLILIALQLKLLTKNKIVFILYMLSFPTLLYSMFFEKHQLCVFLIVAYVFSRCNEKENTGMLVSAAGCMPTSSFIGIVELFTSEKIQKKLLNVLRIVITTILMLICLGRFQTLRYGISEIKYEKNLYASRAVNIRERVISTTKMIQGSFVALPSRISNEMYTWNHLMTKISLPALVICIIIAIGGIISRKSMLGKTFTAWSLFALILFVGFNWSVHESPLFSIDFSWALIPLFVLGLDFVIKKTKANPKFMYGAIVFIMLILNLSTLLDIATFLQRI